MQPRLASHSRETSLLAISASHYLSAALMSQNTPRTLAYKRSRFSAQLPLDTLYSPSHAWAARQADGSWRVGITKFATRMLGDMVEAGWEVEPGTAVACGQVVGWVEGFKAISDVYGIVDGEFLGANPLLKTKITTVNKDPHGHGWLYAATGTPEARCLDVQGYVKLLDKTIDKILEKEMAEGEE